MQSLHNHLMSIVAASQQEGNNVKQNTPPSAAERFRLSPATLGVTLSDELLAQLDRYCEANLVTPRTKPNEPPRPIPRSKVIRRAVYELLENHRVLYRTPSQLPSVGLPPERPNNVSWTMPQNKPADIQRFHELCAHHGLKQFVFTRRAIYLYTVKYKSPDKTKSVQAASDAWF
jgi:hypothetical protein